ncbi:WD domain, G-beta repeat domain-containing protein [Hirsutella rhossiliensis]
MSSVTRDSADRNGRILPPVLAVLAWGLRHGPSFLRPVHSLRSFVPNLHVFRWVGSALFRSLTSRPSNGYNNIRTLQGHEHSISTVRFVPSGTLLVSASGDQTLRIWDTATGYFVRTLQGHDGWNTLILVGHENVVKCCALAPSASYPHLAAWGGLKTPPPASSTAEFMASGSRDKTIKLWDARGGRYLLSVADDKTLRCWDLSQQGSCVKVLKGTHGQFITCLRWASSGVVGRRACGQWKRRRGAAGLLQ